MAEPLVKWAEVIGCEEEPMVVSVKDDVYKVEYPSKSKGATLTLLYFRRTHDLFDSTEPPQRCASVRMSCFLFLDNQLRQNARLSVPTTYVESLSAGAGEPTNRCCGRSPDRATTRDRRSPLPFDLSCTQNAKRRPAVGPRAGSGDPRTTVQGQETRAQH